MFGTFWNHLDAILGDLGSRPGPDQDHFEACLGLSWACLGAALGLSWGVLASLEEKNTKKRWSVVLKYVRAIMTL